MASRQPASASRDTVVAEVRRAPGPVVEPFGDAALLIVLGDRADEALTALARSIAEAIQEVRAAHPGLGRPVPAHATVLVPFDQVAIERGAAMELVRTLARDVHPPAAGDTPGLTVEIPVRYGGPDGPDLDGVAAATGLSAAEVVDLHASADHRVLFLGFAPGFPYLGGLPSALAMPRRASPRERVPAGSVGIAGEQTGIYPRDMPGGWQLIGRTHAVLFDPARDEPALLAPGTAVRFVPVR
jgi:KipI family sensor histidine kinase inhibitor